VVLGAEAEGVVRQGRGVALGVEHLPIWGVLVAGDDGFRVRIDQRRDVAVVVADDPTRCRDGKRSIDLSKSGGGITGLYNPSPRSVISGSVPVSIPRA